MTTTYPLNRRTFCPHCEASGLSVHHFRDAGDLGPDEAKAAGYCPTLARRRTSAELADLDLCTNSQAELAELLYERELES